MKLKSTVIIASVVAASALSTVSAETGFQISKLNGETLQFGNSTVAAMTFVDGNAVVTGVEGEELTIARAEIGSMSSIESVATEYSVTFDGATATVVNPYALKGVTTEFNGAYVTTTNPDEATELTFALNGSTTDGSYTYNGVFKCSLKINGVNITSQQGAAIDIQCGKRIAVTVTGENNLVDFAGGTQKACLYFKGHPELTGSGVLNLTGNAKHALSSKEYLQLKKSFGTINVLAAEGDGIHAGQYFQMNGGKVVIRNVKDDGIQAEITSDETDELNGQMIIKGGTIDVLCEANGVIVDTTTTTATSVRRRGPGGFPGGWGGGFDQEDTETSCMSCLKSDDLMTISGGTLILKATGKGGKCIKCDGELVIGAADTEGPSISATTTGGVVTGSGENLSGQPKAIKAYGNIYINSGSVNVKTTGQGGEGIESKSAITVNDGTVVCNTYDDGINAASKITFNGGITWSYATNNDGIDCNGSSGFEFNGGIVLSSGASSPEEGFDCDNYSFVINGGTLIGTGGASSTPTKAGQPFKVQSSQSLTANTYLSLQKSDGTVICSYLVPNKITATVLVSSPEFASGTSYKLVRNSTAVSNPTESYLDGRFTIGGTLTGGTSTSITPATK